MEDDTPNAKKGSLTRRGFLDWAGKAGIASLLATIPGHGQKPSDRSFASPRPDDPPRGTLMPIGGGMIPEALDKLYDAEKFDEIKRRVPQMTAAECDPHGIIDRLLSLAETVPSHDGNQPTLEIITAGSGNPVKAAELYALLFNRIADVKGHNVIIKTIAPSQFNDPAIAARMSQAGGVFLSGGDQSKLVKTYGDTEACRRMIQRWRTTPGFVIAGSSAGAMAMAGFEGIKDGRVRKLMIADRPKHPDTVPETDAAFGLLPGIGLEAHVDAQKHRRERDMLELVSKYNPAVAIGLDEATCLVIGGNGQATTYGSGRTLVMGHALSIPDASGHLVTGEQFKRLPNCESFGNVPVYCFRHGESFSLADLAPNPTIPKHPAPSLAGSPGR